MDDSKDSNIRADENDQMNRKLRQYFSGKIVRKDLTKKIKEGANVPVYVLEFLLGQYCGTDDPDIIEQGVNSVKRILAENYVRPDEAQKILSVLRQRGSYSVIDKITVSLNIKKDSYEAEFSNLGIKAIPISEEYPTKYDRLALRREKVDAKDVEDCSFIVPGATLNDLEKLCGDTDEKVNITVGAKHISFVVGDTVLVSRRLEGEFLNYSRSIPSEFAITVEADKEDMVQAVSRVSIIVDERTKNPLRLKLEEGLITIWCNTGVSQGKDQCPVKGGKDASLEIGFNNRYLLDALKAAPAENVKLCFNNASSPCVVLPADGSDGFSYMILPVRLKAGA